MICNIIKIGSAKKLLALSVLVLGALLSPNAKASVEVLVAAYVFPPFLNSDQKTGLTPELIQLLNEHQSEYEFKLKITSPKRRFNEIVKGQADVILFEMPEWGWAPHGGKYQVTDHFLNGTEVFIAPARLARDQSYFTNIDDKQIAAMFGYHYAFADFQSDRAYLQDRFKITLVHKPERIIELVSNQRAELGIVTRSFLNMSLENNPKLKSQIKISDTLDQKYQLKAILSNSSAISTEQLENFISELTQSEKINALTQKYGVSSQFGFTP